jgi:uncharacterized membrane protein (UPF0127 family)
MAVLAVVAVVACNHPQPRPRGEPEVVLQVRDVDVHVKVEVARSDDERHRGLMFRQSLEAGRGMLFLWSAPEPLKFWMKNTYIPLDMIFIDHDHRVVGVEENAEPLTTNPRGPDEDSQFVLEVPGGWAHAHGVERGVVVRFVGVD